MVLAGTAAEWEQRAEMAVRVSGVHVVADALNLVGGDREQDRAVHREENLWMRHR